MSPEKIKKAYPECDKESRTGLLPPKYGYDPTDEADIILEQREEHRYDGKRSTVHYQTTGNPSPEDELTYERGKEIVIVIPC